MARSLHAHIADPNAGWSRRTAVASFLALAAVTAGLAGCSGTTAPSPTPTPTSSSDTGTTNVFAIRVGDCVTDRDANGTVESARVVDCSGPHSKEAYANFLVPNGAYPGTAAITALATSDCETAFGTFAGISYNDSKVLSFTWYSPTEKTWASNDRQILCLIFQTDASGKPIQTTGTLQGANK
jgi:hypothetical protein